MAILGPTTNHQEIRLWAESRGAVAVEVLPTAVDCEPALIRLMLKAQGEDRHARILPWDEFFLKFDALDLTLVYDSEPTGYNELLQREDESTYRHPLDAPIRQEN